MRFGVLYILFQQHHLMKCSIINKRSNTIKVKISKEDYNSNIVPEWYEDSKMLSKGREENRRNKVHYDETWAILDSARSYLEDKITVYNSLREQDFKATILPDCVRFGFKEHGRIEGKLPPSEIIIWGGSDEGAPIYDRDFDGLSDYTFEKDSIVGTKFRGSSYYAPIKHWTK